MSDESGASWGLVMSSLYIGDRRIAKDKDQMEKLGITFIVNATNEIRNYFEDDKYDNFRYFRAPAADTDVANIGQYFDDAVEFIEEGLSQGHGVLVHCQQETSNVAG